MPVNKTRFRKFLKHEEGKEIKEKNIHFEVDRNELSEIFDSSSEIGSKEWPHRYKNIDFLCNLLKTDKTKGITRNDMDIRKKVFGINVIPPKPPASFLSLVWAALQDFTLIILMMASFTIVSINIYKMISEAHSVEDEPANSTMLNVTVEPTPTEIVAKKHQSSIFDWVEGASIMAAVVIAVLITAINDWKKERQFFLLQQKVQCSQSVTVVRKGDQKQIPVFEIVVGDVLAIKYGDSIPADGIVIDSNDLRIDESSLTGESDLVKKKITGDTVLFSGTNVMEGSAIYLILAVGENSKTGKLFALLRDETMEEEDEKNNKDENHLEPVIEIPKPVDRVSSDEETLFSDSTTTEEESKPDTVSKGRSVLQAKLNSLALRIGYAGAFFALLTLIILVVQYSVETFVTNGMEWDSLRDIKEYIGHITIAVTVLVVAVPEGLPLAVTLSLAFAMRMMMKDHNLVRHLHACETMGNATTICSDKTGTLTTNRMTVVKSYISAKVFKSTTKTRKTITAWVRHMLIEAISLNTNTSSRIIEPAPGTGSRVRTQLGNTTECALLGWVVDVGGDYTQSRNSVRPEQIVHVYTFNSARKCMATVIDRDTKFRVYVKGASEILLRKCIGRVKGDEVIALDAKEMKVIEREVVESMASEGLRTLTVAYRDIPKSEVWGPEYWELEDDVINDLTMGGIFGIEDPVRPEVPDSILKCQRAGIIVRMVTGDNLSTARSIAKKCGIIGTKVTHKYSVMEGTKFNRLIRNKSGFVSQRHLDRVWPYLRVLARSSPKDKYNLVNGIIQSQLSRTREVVAVTGDGTNDAPALKKADVGFAMGITGTDVAREASDIILTDDNFTSIVRAVVWGRSVYDSISKFIQFQLTVNVVAVFLAFIGVCISGQSPIEAIQMLWVNLIMDTLASLALATEAPTDKLLSRPPYGRLAPLISPIMFRNIFFHSMYQLTITVVMMVFLHKWLDLDSFLEAKGHPTIHATMVFNSFVMMTLCNELNSRRIDDTRNVLQNITHNPIFSVIWVISLFVQFLLVQFGGDVTQTRALMPKHWMICLALGLSTLIYHQFVISIPMPLWLVAKIYGRGYADSLRNLKRVGQSDEEYNMHRGTRASNPGFRQDQRPKDRLTGHIIPGIKRLSNQMNALDDFEAANIDTVKEKYRTSLSAEREKRKHSLINGSTVKPDIQDVKKRDNKIKLQNQLRTPHNKGKHNIEDYANTVEEMV